MEISYPRRILAVSAPDSGLPDLIKALTGASPTPTTDSISGHTHPWAVKTVYYSTTLPIWLDEITNISTWTSDFLAPEAKEVLTAVGAFIVCFRKPIDQAGLKKVTELLEGVGEVVKKGCGFAWDGVCLAVAMPQSISPCLERGVAEWEELCQDAGFEFVDFEGTGRNEYSEPMGIERLKEALEANEWEGGGDLDGEIDFDDFDADDEVTSGFGIEAAEMEIEMFGMKQAIYGNGTNGDEEDEDADQDEEVEKLQAMMQKMQAVRDMGADLPEAERKRLAAKTVNDIMKSL